jgi:hypothetical protein
VRLLYWTTPTSTKMFRGEKQRWDGDEQLPWLVIRVGDGK